jgi:hypothetical protein
MGYRELLKSYMAQLRAVLGSDYVEELGKKTRLTKREIGELRTISAELTRESFVNADREKLGQSQRK